MSKQEHPRQRPPGAAREAESQQKDSGSLSRPQIARNLSAPMFRKLSPPARRQPIE